MLITGIVILTAAVAACYSPEVVDRFWVSLLPVFLFIAYLNPRFRLLCLFISCYLWTIAFIHWQLDHRLASDQNNKRLVVVGEVFNIPKSISGTTKFTFKPSSIVGYDGRLPRKIRLNWRNAPIDLHPGQRWSLTLKLKQPHGYQNPGGFDYERWMFHRGIHATGYVVRTSSNKLLDEKLISLNAVRHAIKQHISKLCPDCNNQGLIQALAIGYRGAIDSQTRQLLNQTGTAHLIAVSGLHIGIISAVFYSLGLLLWFLFFYKTRLKKKEVAFLLAWTAGFCYSLVAGFELPAQRAMLMLTVVLLSLLLRSPFNLLNSLQSALMLVIIFSPLSVLSESFWLTFSALMIIAFGAFLLQRQSSRLKQLVIIQLLFSILFIPVSISIFGQVHSASMAANLIAVPLVSFIIVPLNFILLLLFWLPQEVLQPLYGLLDRLLDVLTAYLSLLQNNGFQAIRVSQINGWKIFGLILFLTLLLMPRGFLSRNILWLALPPLVFLKPYPQSKTSFMVTVLDVGMGNSIVIQTAQHSLVYDLGPGNNQGYSLGEWVVLPFLLHEGISKPDLLILSHSDQDHAGGFYALQDEFKNVPVISGTPQAIRSKFDHAEFVQDCHQTSKWVWDSVVFEFLSDQPAITASDNDRSCVLKVTLNNSSFLIAGDIEKKQEKALILKDRLSLKADFLVASHHGSLTSSTEEFIQAVAADHVIFTTGYLNRWNFPKPEIQRRYLKNGSQIMQTDRTGAIQISCKPEDCEIVNYRQQYPRVWY